MVCASGFADAALAASQMSWAHWKEAADWSRKAQFPIEDFIAHSWAAARGGAEVPGATAASAPTAATKEVLKLRKKLREIARLEEQWGAGLPIEPLQQRKLEKKAELVAQMEQAERAAADEAASGQQQQQEGGGAADSQQAAEQWPEWSSESAGEGFAAQVQAGAMQMLPYHPFVMYDVHGRPQQQALSWPAYAFAAQERALVGAPLQPEFHPAPQERGERQPAPAVSASARRRLRRQRQAERRTGDEQAGDATPELLSPRGSDSGAGRQQYAAMIEALEAGEEEQMAELRTAALAEVHGKAARLAYDHQGCRLLQAAIHAADRVAAAGLAQELHGHVRSLLASPHGNYVLQTVVTALPTATSGFVASELLGAGAQSARHRFGCRILCRLIEHSGTSSELALLLAEVLAEAEELCRHPFAHYVIQAILEHMPAHRPRIVQALCAEALSNACHRSASHVMESALEYCDEAARQEMLWVVLGGGAESIAWLAQNQYGSFVLRTLLKVPGGPSEEAIVHLSQLAACLAGTRHGQRLLQDVGLSAPGDA